MTLPATPSRQQFGAREGTGSSALRDAYRAVRGMTERLCAHLSPEDQQPQSMPDASPAKWHRAHTTWFFETFVLREHAPDHEPDPDFAVLFNSYYNAIGEQYPRPERGLVTRPGVREVGAWRERVDAAMERLLERAPSDEVVARTVLGLNHEQQHQELLLTDVKHLFSRNPTGPALVVDGLEPRGCPLVDAPAPRAPRFHDVPGGEHAIGSTFEGFAFDMEGPRHAVLLQPFAIAERLVTNAEYLAFMADGGYRRPELWLSAGWDFVREHGLEAPLYWARAGDAWTQYTLLGTRQVDPREPVVHVSYYEADAYARWADARLATEAEWEVACVALDAAPRVEAPGAPTALHPQADDDGGPRQLFGAAWQWTRSSYEAYPRYRPAAGAIGEYNGKFMSGQYVLRGSSCATPRGHARATYRNFFPPGTRWQFSGIRLAQDRA